MFTPRPLGPLFDLAAELGGRIGELCRRGAPREELFDALLQQVNARPYLLVIEDLHWADEATVDLARRLRGTRLIVAYRDDELDPHRPLRIALGRLGSLRGPAGSAWRRFRRARSRCWPVTVGSWRPSCTG
ncbi:hypothetical protein AB0J83_39815 [Actinoplanes sp. NPDC049596]|uniref:hypothetical protein n=1 Tax=unclassified Actinoplanes TaxID=2626549 RepID=UPI00344A7ADA